MLSLQAIAFNNLLTQRNTDGSLKIELLQKKPLFEILTNRPVSKKIPLIEKLITLEKKGLEKEHDEFMKEIVQLSAIKIDKKDPQSKFQKLEYCSNSYLVNSKITMYYDSLFPVDYKKCQVNFNSIEILSVIPYLDLERQERYMIGLVGNFKCRKDNFDTIVEHLLLYRNFKLSTYINIFLQYFFNFSSMDYLWMEEPDSEFDSSILDRRQNLIYKLLKFILCSESVTWCDLHNLIGPLYLNIKRLNKLDVKSIKLIIRKIVLKEESTCHTMIKTFYELLKVLFEKTSSPKDLKDYFITIFIQFKFLEIPTNIIEFLIDNDFLKPLRLLKLILKYHQNAFTHQVFMTLTSYNYHNLPKFNEEFLKICLRFNYDIYKHSFFIEKFFKFMPNKEDVIMECIKRNFAIVDFLIWTNQIDLYRAINIMCLHKPSFFKKHNIEEILEIDRSLEFITFILDKCDEHSIILEEDIFLSMLACLTKVDRITLFKRIFNQHYNSLSNSFYLSLLKLRFIFTALNEILDIINSKIKINQIYTNNDILNIRCTISTIDKLMTKMLILIKYDLFDESNFTRLESMNRFAFLELIEKIKKDNYMFTNNTRYISLLIISKLNRNDFDVIVDWIKYFDTNISLIEFKACLDCLPPYEYVHLFNKIKHISNILNLDYLSSFFQAEKRMCLEDQVELIYAIYQINPDIANKIANNNFTNLYRLDLIHQNRIMVYLRHLKLDIIQPLIRNLINFLNKNNVNKLGYNISDLLRYCDYRDLDFIFEKLMFYFDHCYKKELLIIYIRRAIDIEFEKDSNTHAYKALIRYNEFMLDSKNIDCDIDFINNFTNLTHGVSTKDSITKSRFNYFSMSVRINFCNLHIMNIFHYSDISEIINKIIAIKIDN